MKDEGREDPRFVQSLDPKEEKPPIIAVALLCGLLWFVIVAAVVYFLFR